MAQNSSCEEKLESTHSDEDLSFLPLKLRKRLMFFQKEGVKFALSKDGRVLIADEMGLGKTLQALSVAYYYKHDWPLLIIVPSSLRYPWIEELEKWMPEIHPHEINLIQGGADINDIQHSTITIVTYGLLRHPGCHLVREALCNQHFKVVIADESHYLKNRNSATSKYLVPLIKKAERKILLTGTPALARPEELYPQLDALGPGKFGNWSSFSRRYCNAGIRQFGRIKRWMTDGASNLEELQYLLSKLVMIRRLKKDVLTQLPAKQRQKIPFELKDSEVKKSMDSSWNEMLKILDRDRTNLSQAMRDPANHMPGDIQETAPGRYDVLRLMCELHNKTCAVKLGPVKEYVKMLCENAGLKILIFAYHHLMMNSIMEQLMEDGVKYIRIDGNTVPQDRPRLVHQYQVDPQTRVAILSIKAAGVGLTLTAAKLVVFAELDWTPGTLEQCEDRAHRIGQKDTVHIHYLVAKGTLDEWVWSAIAKKTAVVTTTLNGQTQVLRMDDPNRGQVECLSKAEAYIPSQTPRPAENLAQFFQSQTLQASGQKTLLQYFTPNSKKTKLATDKSSPSGYNKVKNFKDNSERTEKVIEILLDSDDDEDAFKSTEVGKGRRKQQSKRKNEKAKDKRPINDSLNSSLEREGEVETEKVCSPIDNTEDSFSCSNADLDDIPELRPLRKRKRKHTGESVGSHLMKQHDSKEKDTQVPKAPSSGDADKWGCSMCTFLNHSALSVCEMCSSPKVHKRSKSFRESLSKTAQMQCDLLTSSARTPPRTFSGDSPGHFKSPSSSCSPWTPKNDYTRVPNSTSTPNRGSTWKRDSRETNVTTQNLDASGRKIVNTDTCYNFSKVCQMDIEDNTILSGPESLGSTDLGSQDTVIEEVSTQDEETEPNISWSESSVSEPTNSAQAKVQLALETIDSDTIDSDTIDSDYTINDSQDSEIKITDLSQESSEFSVMRKSGPSFSHENTVPTPSCADDLQLDPDVVSQETAAAKNLFSSGQVAAAVAEPWTCPQCEMFNEESVEDCEGCLASRPQDQPTKREPENHRVVDLDSIPVYDIFQYCCSKNTSRIYLYDQAGNALNVNFTTLDIEMDNYAQLPDLLLHPQNLKLVHRFVREWNSLAPTKRRIVVRSGQIFVSPCLLYEELKSGKKGSRQRYITKNDVAASSINKAEQIGGSVRVIAPASPPFSSSKKKTMKQRYEQAMKAEERAEAGLASKKMKGIVQALDTSGRPLCVYCHKAYENSLITDQTVDRNPWQTRFCSRECMQQYWVRTHRTMATKEVYEAEHGICQLCQLDAQEFFLRIKNTACQKRRAELIQKSTYKTLKSSTKERMVKQPNKGLFWHVDHIKPVAEGGGECDIDNLRTLCTVCHMNVTAQQNKDRAGHRKMKDAARCGDITAFFKPS